MILSEDLKTLDKQIFGEETRVDIQGKMGVAMLNY